MVSKGSLFIVGAVPATFRLAAARRGQAMLAFSLPERGIEPLERQAVAGGGHFGDRF
jgi:hypothetical protein